MRVPVTKLNSIQVFTLGHESMQLSKFLPPYFSLRQFFGSFFVGFCFFPPCTSDTVSHLIIPKCSHHLIPLEIHVDNSSLCQIPPSSCCCMSNFHSRLSWCSIYYLLLLIHIIFIPIKVNTLPTNEYHS